MKKRIILILTSCFLIISLLTSCSTTAAAEKQNVIGIAWRSDEDSEFYTNICKAIEDAGGTWVKLEQVKSADLSYNELGRLTEGVDENGALDMEASKSVRLNTWHDSNAASALKDISFVIFTGGEDISSYLFFTPEVWHGIAEEKDYNAERDVSDYLTMSYCLDNDIPFIGMCRGLQMLAVVSGSEMIQDIPTFFDEKDLPYAFEHRNQKETPSSYRDYSSHPVIVEKGSRLYDIVKTETLEGCPSWHHQATKDVSNTRLSVTGYTPTSGIDMIEALERTDKTFAVGIQFHPEAAVVKHLENAENKDKYMDYEKARSFFTYIVDAVSSDSFSK